MMMDRPRVVPVDIGDELKKSMLEYSMCTLVERALPDVRDGLKPSQRRILVAMNDLGLAPNRQHRKCRRLSHVLTMMNTVTAFSATNPSM